MVFWLSHFSPCYLSVASEISAVFPFHHRMEDCGFQVLTAVYRFGGKCEFTE